MKEIQITLRPAALKDAIDAMIRRGLDVPTPFFGPTFRAKRSQRLAYTPSTHAHSVHIISKKTGRLVAGYHYAADTVSRVKVTA